MEIEKKTKYLACNRCFKEIEKGNFCSDKCRDKTLKEAVKYLNLVIED